MTESSWEILKLDWKLLDFFFFQKSGNPVTVLQMLVSVMEHNY